MKKIALLILLGFLWSARLAAIKAAGLSGIPIHVTISLSVMGIMILFTSFALLRRTWPPVEKKAVVFYITSGVLGFILPFILENLVAPRLSVFVFVVIIATMPVVTLLLSIVLKIGKIQWPQYVAVGLGFGVAVLIAGDTIGSSPMRSADWTWVFLAFGVPFLYAVNTLFVATKWPNSVNATQVAHAQAIIVSAAIVVGSASSGLVSEWYLVGLNVPAIVGISCFEGFALLVYLKVTRDHGATFVSMANYISMVFAAIIGALLFGDELTWLSAAAAAVLIVSLSLIQWSNPRLPEKI